MTITLLSGNGPRRLEVAKAEDDEPWVAAPELPVAAGWELKPEGMCRDDICIEIPEDRRSRLVRQDAAGALVNLSEFARLIEQPFVHDEAGEAWYFGPPSWEWQSRLGDAEAPDFSLPD